jgi:hypothetical protein
MFQVAFGSPTSVLCGMGVGQGYPGLYFIHPSPKDMGTRKIKLCYGIWWQHCTHCMAVFHASCFCALEVAQNDIRPCHS